MLRRIDKLRSVTHTPMLRPQRAKYELAEKSQAVACGGLGMILELVKQTGLRDEINRAVSVLKLHAPYDEADHVLNIALNLLTGGTCLEHLELRRTDEAYLNALGAPGFPILRPRAIFVGGSVRSTRCISRKRSITLGSESGAGKRRVLRASDH